VLSNPDSARLARAFASLDFMLAIDIYLNETSRHADVILPGTSPFDDCHYDSFLGAMTYRNTARYSPALRPLDDRPDEWALMLSLAYLATFKAVPDRAALAGFEDAVVAQMARAYLDGSADPAETEVADAIETRLADVLSALATRRGVERILDLGIRMGPWGDRFGARQGLTLARLIEQPDSIDMGPLEPRLGEALGHATLDLAPDVIIRDLDRLQREADTKELRLIGRRNIQTNNSWLHNLPLLSTGPDRARLEMHPDDAEARQIRDGDRVAVRSDIGELRAVVTLSSALMPGTVCLPHGFSEEQKPGQRVARSGPNSNVIAPADYVDVPSATVALNGIAVSVALYGGERGEA